MMILKEAQTKEAAEFLTSTNEIIVVRKLTGNKQTDYQNQQIAIRLNELIGKETSWAEIDNLVTYWRKFKIHII